MKTAATEYLIGLPPLNVQLEAKGRGGIYDSDVVITENPNLRE
jgi:hypothetical protein